MSTLTQLLCAASRSHLRNGSAYSYRLYCASTPIEKKIEGLVNEKDVVVFMKGVPGAPQCGFSNAVMQILTFHGLQHKENAAQKNAVYSAHNVLEDEELRDGTKIK